MNWYEMKLVNEAHLEEFHEAADMERLAESARGNRRISIGLEDVLSARALVKRITAEPAAKHPAPRLTFQPARR